MPTVAEVRLGFTFNHPAWVVERCFGYTLMVLLIIRPLTGVSQVLCAT